MKDISKIQQSLHTSNLDGWLLYDFRKTNDLACRFLEIPAEKLVTRRFFYWIPAVGVPIKLLHRIEPNVLSHLPGEAHLYGSWEELEKHLATILKGAKRIAMEYSPRNAIPYLSKVDAGTIELVQSFGPKVCPSGDLLQAFTSVWSKEQLDLHLQAAQFLDTTVNKAWNFISQSLQQQKKITERDVQSFLIAEFDRAGFISEDPPICAVNAHSADPHYCIEKESGFEIRKGDFILIDLWCKKKHPNAVYADITRVASASKATAKQQQIFSIVKNARDAAMALLAQRLSSGKTVAGWELDQACRRVIVEAGYGEFFTHRTGHNIGERDHGDGAHIDNFETKDTRLLLPSTCFSIEPGIYLPGEFGIRLEHDVYLEADGRNYRVTGGLQLELRELKI